MGKVDSEGFPLLYPMQAPRRPLHVNQAKSTFLERLTLIRRNASTRAEQKNAPKLKT